MAHEETSPGHPLVVDHEIANLTVHLPERSLGNLGIV
jgi:hypothetical protein